MTLYDIPNIEHCDIVPVGTIADRIYAHEGWYIYLADEPPGMDVDGNPTKIYKTVAILFKTYDYSMVEITAEADLPSNAEICGGGNDNNHEVV